MCELLDGYDPSVRPFGRNPTQEKRKGAIRTLENTASLGGPVEVQTSLYIASISAVNERNMVGYKWR